MQALKGLVIVLGLIIVLVMGVLVWGLFKKSENPDFKMFTFSSGGDKAAAPAAPSGGTAPPAPRDVQMAWGTVSLNLPAGCAIQDMSSDLGKLYVRTGSDGAPVPGCARVVVIDPATGRTLGTVMAGP